MKDHPFLFPNIESKLEFLKECITQVENQLHQRHTHHISIDQELDERICEIQSEIYTLELYSIDSPNRNTLQSQIKLLEKEKRQTQLEYWKDCAEMQKELRLLKKEYWMVKAGCLQHKT